MIKKFLISILLFISFIVGLAIQFHVENKPDYYNGHELIKGAQGVSYYINSNGNKTYVVR